MKDHFRNRMYLTVSAIFAVFSAVLAATNIPCGDDILWTTKASEHYIYGDRSLNGRYLTNVLTYVAVRVWIVRFLIAFVFLLLLHQLILRVIGEDYDVPGWAAVFTAIALLTIRSGMFTQTLNWTSGFACYVVASVILMTVLLYCKPLFCGKKLERKKYTAVFMLLLGFGGSLCLENVTIYSIFLGIFLIIYSWKCHKSVHPGLPAYLAGAAGGAVLMFTNHTYSSLFGSSSDESGFRSVTMDFSDIFHQIYEELITYYCAPFWILHIVICVSFMFMYHGKFSSSEPPRYTKAALTAVSLYTAYSFFTNIFGGFSVWNAALTIRGIETAFTFIYIISLLFLGSVLCSRQSFVRFAFYIASTIVLSAPFAAANPVTERCFFVDLIFWILAAGELSCRVVSAHSFERCYPLRFLSVITAGFIAFAISYMCAWNKYTDVKRFKYIRQQLDDERKSIEFISLPYPSYIARDELESYKTVLDLGEKEDYENSQEVADMWMSIGKNLMSDHGISEDFTKLNIVMISLYDYDLK